MEQNKLGHNSILVVEDDEKIRRLIRIYLQNAGFEVWEAGDGEEAQRLFNRVEPCFVIMDLMLPKQSGEALCQWIRGEKRSDVPIIMLTAKVDEQQRIYGLQLGADDYVTKPFSPKELVVRVETVLRRTPHQCSKISYRELTLRPNRGEVTYRGEAIELTQHEFRLLHFFMKHPNQIVTREQILEELYPNDERSVIDRTVDVHVSKLRDKLKRVNEDEKLIDTVRGMGYRFAAY
ncbi:response regulator transcription factor [Paenibacillus chungangensis]|uniref:Response regulator transcription factor n=1 Tax=Paenibacillus chungangensis TaxID=696535 RepID=A0ABW3HMZ7_9BACL